MSTNILAAVAAIALLGAPVIAAAAPATIDADNPQLVVKYSDLNTATPAGQAALHSRVSQAAALVCGGKPENLLDVGANQRFHACVTKAIGAALTRIPAPREVAGAPNHNG